MTFKVQQKHFEQAIIDIIKNGDNDILPFDIDRRFIEKHSQTLTELAFKYFEILEKEGSKEIKKKLKSLLLFSERLLSPTGSTGFRIATKIHPFWNFYFNGLGVAIAEAHEPKRSHRAMSYRFLPNENGLFNRENSWRSYLQATMDDNTVQTGEVIIIKTDISSFYDRIYHHQVENCINDLIPNSTISAQVSFFLQNFAAGRSYGLPVGGQCARILAELLISSVDRRLNDAAVNFYRYVDDFTIIASDQVQGYKDLSLLSHILANYGLSLNRIKTTILSVKHYIDYVSIQLDCNNDNANKLRQIELHFDPYSDEPQKDYDELRNTVSQLEVQKLLDCELQKSQPDNFLVTQIIRTLKFHTPEKILQLCQTLLDAKNLHSFRGSFSKIMRAISAILSDEQQKYNDIINYINDLLDQVIEHSSHLLVVEVNCLFYLKAIRFKQNNKRSQYLNTLYNSTSCETIKRGCIECWCKWNYREAFDKLKDNWNTLHIESQRMLWLGAKSFGDAGNHFQRQKKPLKNSWRLGIEKENDQVTFASLYMDWAEMEKI